MCKNFVRAVLVLISIFSSFPTTLRASTLPISDGFGYLQEGIADLKKPEKQIAIDVWNKWVAQEGNFHLTTYSAATMADFITLIETRKIDYALLDSSNFIQYYHQLKPNLKDETWIVQRTEKTHEEYVLLTRMDSNATELNKLKGATLSLNTALGLLKMYMDYIVMKTVHTSADKYFSVIREAKTESQAILDVYFGYSDVCLVAKHVLDDSIELNPAIQDKVKIIHRSGEILVPALYIAFNNASDLSQSRFSRSMEKLHNTVRGQQMLNLFGIHAIKKIKLEKLYPLLKLNAQLHQQKFR